MEKPLLRVGWLTGASTRSEPHPESEWLLTNGLSGYAAGTLTGYPTRRYHGLLIAALPHPLARQLLLNHLAEELRLPNGATVFLDQDKIADGAAVTGMTEFRLELGLPVWRYELGKTAFEKRVFMVHGQNTTLIHYRLVDSDGARVHLRLRPWLHFRFHDSPVGVPEGRGPYHVTETDGMVAIQGDAKLPPLLLQFHGLQPGQSDGTQTEEVFYRLEQGRGYPSRGELWSPTAFAVEMGKDDDLWLVASAEPAARLQGFKPGPAAQAERQRREDLLSAADPALRDRTSAQLVLATDQFLVTPAVRADDVQTTAAQGDEARTVIAGYYWFTDWGRDTMISLEGLTLLTGRHREAGCILRTFAASMRNGLIPNLFPEGQQKGLYNTADATLWFFHAIDRYVAITGDHATLRTLLPKLRDSVDHHLRGTDFGIKVDPADGLLHQGAAGYQLTWMDAKVGDWVVTPRRGKAVEINALWYNALRLLENWLRTEQDETAAAAIAPHADKAAASFNRRFWYAQGGYLYDVVDGEAGDDHALRPNQVFAISLQHPVLARERWQAVLDVVRSNLLTPVGLRSLGPEEPGYHPAYFGDRRSRDAAYHQGTVWPWLLGAYVDAWLAAYPGDERQARTFLDGIQYNLATACMGSISEIFDAELPYTPRGCIAQAWSVAEALRALARTAGKP